ncbi:MAG TPA: hypothetical protein VI583_11490, partial [Cyclobacteriaceae bacterium]|nr:hypothetical protein [Cyclobacteriaceae bacterium]
FEGIGGWEIPGAEVYPTTPSAHREDATCVKCHMYNFNHEFEPSLDACNTCHDNVTSFDVNGVQTSISNKLEILHEKLVDANMIDGTTGSYIAGKFPTKYVGALYNYKIVHYDKSHGVHNPKYIEALLDNSIDVFN